MISPERIENLARRMVVGDKVLAQIRRNEELMIGKTREEVYCNSSDSENEVLRDHLNKFHGLSYMLAEIAGPFKKIRDL